MGPPHSAPERLSRREAGSYGKYFYHRCRHIWSGETSVLSKSQRCSSPSAVRQLLLLTARQKAASVTCPQLAPPGRATLECTSWSLLSHRERALLHFTAKQRGREKAEHTGTPLPRWCRDSTGHSGEWDQTGFGVQVCILNTVSKPKWG